MVQYINSLIFKLTATFKLFIFYCILTFSVAQNIHAASTTGTTTAPAKPGTMDTIISILSGLTCETQGIGNLLRSEFSHTCVPASFFTYAVANILSPGMYVTALLHLKINDHELFDGNFPGGQCLRSNRADKNDLKLSFAFCNNILLGIYRAVAVGKAAIAIGKAVLTGEDPWDDIKAIWLIDKEKYHKMYTEQRPGSSGVEIDIAIPFRWEVERIQDRICVSTSGFTGLLAVGCKYIKEPWPISIYANFISLANPASSTSVAKASDPIAVINPVKPIDPSALVDCGNMGSCYQRAYNASKAAVVISAPLIECIKEMTARLLISRSVCSFDSINAIMSTSLRESSALFKFQTGMHKIVTAFLTIYVILFGFKLVLSSEPPPKSEIINFVLKIIFVTYFSVGINITSKDDVDNNRYDGMTQFVFPLLLDGISELAGWVMSASPSQLCKFTGDGNEYKYNSDVAYIALWDSLDCHIAHYLGLDAISTLVVENASKKHDYADFDVFSFSIPPYVYLLIPAIYSGNFTLISLALSYPLLIISVAAFMINATIMCMISIVILGILAPLFVPMLLFQYTKGYFESWVKLLISFLLQPMVVTTFMIMMFSVYDLGFYGTCAYKKSVINDSVENLAQGDDSSGNNPRKIFIFYVDNNWNDTHKYPTDDDAKKCRNSLGYMLNNPLAAIYDFDKTNLTAMLQPSTPAGKTVAPPVSKPGTISSGDSMSKYPFLSGISIVPGMFFNSVKLIFEKIKSLVLSLVTACFTLYLMYHFSAQLANFAADMTEGVSLASMTINPQSVYKAGMKALSLGSKAAGGGAADKVAGAAGGSADKVAGGAEGASGDSAAGMGSSGDSVGGVSSGGKAAAGGIATRGGVAGGGVSRGSVPAGGSASSVPASVSVSTGGGTSLSATSTTSTNEGITASNSNTASTSTAGTITFSGGFASAMSNALGDLGTKVTAKVRGDLEGAVESGTGSSSSNSSSSNISSSSDRSGSGDDNSINNNSGGSSDSSNSSSSGDSSGSSGSNKESPLPSSSEDRTAKPITSQAQSASGAIDNKETQQRSASVGAAEITASKGKKQDPVTKREIGVSKKKDIDLKPAKRQESSQRVNKGLSEEEGKGEK